jgi:hypothetical protein
LDDKPIRVNEAKPMASGPREFRGPLAAFAGLIAASMVFLWASRGTQLHQLAIGIALSSITLALALGLFELCWSAGRIAWGAFGRGDGK